MERGEGGRRRGNLGAAHGSGAGTPSPLGSLPGILGLYGIRGFRNVGGSGKIQGVGKGFHRGFTWKREQDPLNGNSSRKIPPV